jgi:hypothetical protein
MMDWYLIGRILGALAWPIAAGFAIYAIGWLIAATRQPPLSDKIKRSSRIAAVVVSLGILFFTMRELLRHLSGS